ncbi:MAG: glycosyltransferase, partial [Bacteroidota bacterium]
VTFHGFIQRNELPRYFAQSTCFLFQTDFDVWGLVLNEAMAAGVAVLSSVNAAATHDLVIDGETGFAVDYNRQDEVLEKLNLLLDSSDLATRIGQNAQHFIEHKSPLTVSAKGFVNSVIEF